MPPATKCQPLLRSLKHCFEGVLPATIATASRDGVPNVANLSHVTFVDDRHVALSRQFFNKTSRNVIENPRALVTVWDPVTFERYQLRVRYLRTETTGPLFERMALRIDAIASHTGMTGVFRLIGADVCAVDSIEHITEHLGPAKCPLSLEDELPAAPGEVPAHERDELWTLHRLCLRMNRATDLAGLLSQVLASLDEDFGFSHGKVLLLDESGQHLFAVASRGYEESGVGAEVALGEGLIGTVAKERRILRLGHLENEMRYGRAVRAEVTLRSEGQPLRPEIPLPGLKDAQSYLALPLEVQERLIGVLALESRNPAAFASWHEAFLGIVAAQVAGGIDRLASPDLPEDAPLPAPPPKPAPRPSRRRREIVFYQNDDCVFVDGEYLIRNVPGRILWKILRTHGSSGRCEFSNRELRLDPALGLPAIKDNLESRLILLRKRLEQKCPDIRLPPRGRGRFGIELDCDLALDERPSA
jgi:adenylate cyclase